jgi:hypothetical protein
MSKTWKSIERKVAAYLGGVRVPITGRQRGSAPDVLHPILSIEVKHREKLPEWIFEAMEQAEMSKAGDQIPIAILHEKGQSIAESLTVMRTSTILELLNKISVGTEEE